MHAYVDPAGATATVHRRKVSAGFEPALVEAEFRTSEHGFGQQTNQKCNPMPALRSQGTLATNDNVNFLTQNQG